MMSLISSDLAARNCLVDDVCFAGFMRVLFLGFVVFSRIILSKLATLDSHATFSTEIIIE